jgi:hypothetical protein
MKISNAQAKRLEKLGKLKPTKETIQTRKAKQDLSKAIVAIESTSKSIDAASTKINKSLLKLVNSSLKSAKNETKSTKKKKWNFTILRDQKGLIKTVEALEI